MVRKQRKLETRVADLQSQFLEFRALASQGEEMKPFPFLRLTLLYNLVVEKNFEEKFNILNPLDEMGSQGLSDLKKSLDTITPIQMLQYHQFEFIGRTGDGVLHTIWDYLPGPKIPQGKLQLLSSIQRETQNLRITHQKLYTLKDTEPEELSESLIYLLKVYKYHLLNIKEVRILRDSLVENSLFRVKAFTFIRNDFFSFITLLDVFLETYFQALFLFAQTYGVALNYFQKNEKL